MNVWSLFFTTIAWDARTIGNLNKKIVLISPLFVQPVIARVGIDNAEQKPQHRYQPQPTHHNHEDVYPTLQNVCYTFHYVTSGRTPFFTRCKYSITKCNVYFTKRILLIYICTSFEKGNWKEKPRACNRAHTAKIPHPRTPRYVLPCLGVISVKCRKYQKCRNPRNSEKSENFKNLKNEKKRWPRSVILRSRSRVMLVHLRDVPSIRTHFYFRNLLTHLQIHLNTTW